MNWLARWAWRRLVAPRVVAYRWQVTSNPGDVWSIDPADVEVVFREGLGGR